ncbi:hypothetical protein DERF_007427 [Dermatophagoides farinae]|uniref:RING-type domain-containing protein n=1 Tax=Dermatophagoides farinae TaxID=6954 RepID=A0A922L3M1_DERFA|nr:hypothetical protein DERF_007427 [Dermatophagoides farinae]
MTRIQTSSGPMMVSRMIFNDTTTFELQNDYCWLCCERTIDCVLLDCGHLISCLSCAQQKIRRFGPVCRRIVWKVARIYLAVA